ncbi:MAG: ABC transporter ATP-binding protein [Pseudomonadota bacterium]
MAEAPQLPHISIDVRKLSKRYVLGASRKGIGRLFRTATGDEHWALNNVSFEIRSGERVGIIGKNGAGKSTLLKILSRVLVPTSGEAIITGRATALLEVGTGFNPQLSGLENIYLTAAIYGLSKAEIEDRVQSIIDFSEVNRFINAPVKQYSSGMRARLGFSICAHLDPEILMLDEVLSVGDAAFQQKCLTRMDDMTSHGRTLLFVSHSMSAVARFCDRCIWIEGGEIVDDGPAAIVCDAYNRSMLSLASTYTNKAQDSAETKSATDTSIETSPAGEGPKEAKEDEEGKDDDKVACELVAVRVLDHQGEVTSTIKLDQDAAIEIEYEVFEIDKRIEPALHFRNESGDMLFVLAFTDDKFPQAINQPGRYLSRVAIPPNLLNTGIHVLSATLVTADPLERHISVDNALAFTVYETHSDDAQMSARGRYARDFPGVIRPRLEWHTKQT